MSSTGMTRRGHWDDRRRGYLDDIFLLGINYMSQCSYSYACMALSHSGNWYEVYCYISLRAYIIYIIIQYFVHKSMLLTYNKNIFVVIKVSSMYINESCFQ
ncbi:MAG: hypothetical protein LBV62_00730 [Rickettsiales bacterium]|nr:hypothetical protein [Rickettsiales bacterium]